MLDLIVLLFSLLPPPNPEFSMESIQCVAANIYHESRGETIQGQIAVANVVMNRANLKFRGNTPCNVVKYYKKKKGKKICQFSWYCDGKKDVINLDENFGKLNYDKQNFSKAQILAFFVVYGIIPDITDGALFYHADYVSPFWASSYKLVKKYDSQLFYAMR